MHAYPVPPTDSADYDLENDATVVAPSPYLALIEQEHMAEAVTNPRALPLPETPTQHAMGYPSAPAIQHTFTEPLRGYPQQAAYVPRHEETGVITTGQDAAHFALAQNESGVQVRSDATVALPATMAMASVSPAAVPAPQYGAGVVSLCPVAVEAAEPLVVHNSGSITYGSERPPAPAPQAPPQAHIETQTEVPRQLRGGRALFGALPGAIAGALLWGAIGYLTGGYEFKYGAVLIGLFTGAGAARLGGGHSKAVGALGAVFGLAGILTGKALFEILVQPHLSLADHIGYHTTVIDLVFYGATIATGFAVGAGTLSPKMILARGKRVLRRYIPSMIG